MTRPFSCFDRKITFMLKCTYWLWRVDIRRELRRLHNLISHRKMQTDPSEFSCCIGIYTLGLREWNLLRESAVHPLPSLSPRIWILIPELHHPPSEHRFWIRSSYPTHIVCDGRTQIDIAAAFGEQRGSSFLLDALELTSKLFLVFRFRSDIKEAVRHLLSASCLSADELSDICLTSSSRW